MTKYYYDLHIHSCLSPCAEDDMTPNNIAGMAALKGLNMLALTDHNSCKNCPAFFKACKNYGIIPIAGVELSSAEDIHLVCMFPTLDAAMDFDRELELHLPSINNRPDIFGNQLITDEEDEVVSTEKKLLISATDMWLSEAVEMARKHGAHVRPAHIDRESNGIVSVLGDIPLDYGFNCFELNDGNNFELYKKRFPFLTKENIIVSSDAHRLWEINEAENYVMIDDEPYSSALVRERFFKYLNKLEKII